MRRLLSLVLMLVIGVLIYNSFFGTPEEKEQAKEVRQELKEVGKSITNLLKSEKEKFDAGKYNNILDKLKGFKGKGEEFGEEYSMELEEIERKIAELEETESKKKRRRSTSEVDEYSTEEQDLNLKLQKLIKKLEKNAEN